MRWLEASELDVDQANGYWCKDRSEDEVLYTILGMRQLTYEEQERDDTRRKGIFIRKKKEVQRSQTAVNDDIVYDHLKGTWNQ